MIQSVLITQALESDTVLLKEILEYSIINPFIYLETMQFVIDIFDDIKSLDSHNVWSTVDA